MTESYSQPSQISKTELFVKIVNGRKSASTFKNSSILDVEQGSGYAFG